MICRDHFIVDVLVFEVLQILKNGVRSLTGASLQNESDLVTACAMLKEIIYRLTGLSLFDTQLSIIGGVLIAQLIDLIREICIRQERLFFFEQLAFYIFQL